MRTVNAEDRQYIDKNITPPRPRNASQFMRVGLLVNKLKNMQIKTLADFKRLPVGTVLTIVKAVDWDGTEWTDHKGMNNPRAIAHKQTNAITFEGGSWLMYPKAKNCVFRDGNIVEIHDEKSKMELHYKVTI